MSVRVLIQWTCFKPRRSAHIIYPIRSRLYRRATSSSLRLRTYGKSSCFLRSKFKLSYAQEEMISAWVQTVTWLSKASGSHSMTKLLMLSCALEQGSWPTLSTMSTHNCSILRPKIHSSLVLKSSKSKMIRLLTTSILPNVIQQWLVSSNHTTVNPMLTLKTKNIFQWTASWYRPVAKAWRTMTFSAFGPRWGMILLKRLWRLRLPLRRRSQSRKLCRWRKNQSCQRKSMQLWIHKN